jgi:aspartate/methionine/tyrosine aminotransferase
MTTWTKEFGSVPAEAQARLLALHRNLDRELRSETRGRFFVSGWRTSHPLASQYIAAVSQPCDPKVLEAYSFLSDSADLEQEIRSFHQAFDGVFLEQGQAFPSVGSSPLIAALMLTLLARGVREITYIAPVYYLFYYYARMFGIRMSRLSASPLCKLDGGRFCLPDEKSVFLFSDPAWVFGWPVKEEYIDTIVEWQRRTESLVIVDGTFQYTQWDGKKKELSSRLDPKLTIRLICPTKSIALHGLRFAYLIIPAEIREDIRYACSNITGATGAQELQGAIATMRILGSAIGNRQLREYIAGTFALAVNSRLIGDVVVPPSATYYTMARLNERFLAQSIVMSASFFELPFPEDVVRINLLHPQIRELIDLVSA